MSNFPHAWANKVILRQINADEVSDTWGSSNLIVPDSAKDRQIYRQWVIEDIGPDCSGDLLLAHGLRVIVSPRAGTHFTWNNQTFLTVLEHEIIALFG